MSYTPQPDSLAGRLCAFFRAHPEEELSLRDVAQKYDVSSHSISALLASCFANHLLARGKDESGTSVIRAGSKLIPLATPHDPQPEPPTFNKWLEEKKQPSAEGRKGPAALPPPESLQIEDGVPIPPGGPGAKAFVYDAVFARMTPGQSFRCSPEAAKRLVASARRWGKTVNRKFITRQVDANTARIWRTE